MVCIDDGAPGQDGWREHGGVKKVVPTTLRCDVCSSYVLTGD
jgi:hypothetical protein